MSPFFANHPFAPRIRMRWRQVTENFNAMSSSNTRTVSSEQILPSVRHLVPKAVPRWGNGHPARCAPPDWGNGRLARCGPSPRPRPLVYHRVPCPHVLQPPHLVQHAGVKRRQHQAFGNLHDNVVHFANSASHLQALQIRRGICYNALINRPATPKAHVSKCNGAGALRVDI